MISFVLSLLSLTPLVAHDDAPQQQRRHASLSKRLRSERRLRTRIGAFSSPLPRVADALTVDHNESILTSPVEFESVVDTGSREAGPATTFYSVGQVSPVPTSFHDLMVFFCDSVMVDESSFGKYCRSWVSSRAPKSRQGRNRDIYPLPLFESGIIMPSLDFDQDLILKICNLSILGLNFMWDDCIDMAPCPTFGNPSTAQATVHRHVMSSVHRMFTRLLGIDAQTREGPSSEQHPDMVADKVDMGPVACTCSAKSS